LAALTGNHPLMSQWLTMPGIVFIILIIHESKWWVYSSGLDICVNCIC